MVRSLPSIFLASYLFCWKCVVFVVSVGLFFFRSKFWCLIVMECMVVLLGIFSVVSVCVFFGGNASCSHG